MLIFLDLIIKGDAQKQMVEFGFDVDFMTLNILKLESFFHISWIHYLLEGIII